MHWGQLLMAVSGLVIATIALGLVGLVLADKNSDHSGALGLYAFGWLLMVSSNVPAFFALALPWWWFGARRPPTNP